MRSHTHIHTQLTQARARGVTRIMRGDQARAVCPEIALVQVAVKHKKADLTPYRNAGRWLQG